MNKNIFEQIDDIAHKKSDDAGTLRRLSSIEQELRKYDEIEQKLGIDLPTIFKALENGVYYKNSLSEILFLGKLELHEDPGAFRLSCSDRHVFLFTDTYGTAWALTKEELI